MANVPFGRDRNEAEWFERGDHPLLNDLLLTTIFDYVRGNDLKTCRLVSRKWNVHTLPFTHLRLQVTIRRSSCADDPRGIESFIKLMSSNTFGISFGTFRLGSFDTTQGFGQQFVQKFGNTTKELHLSSLQDYNVESISELLQAMPELESFTVPTRISSKDRGLVKLFPGTKPELSLLKSLSVKRNGYDDRRTFCSTLYEEIFVASPNISTLVVTSWFSKENDAGTEVLEALEKQGRTIENLKFPEVNLKILTLLGKMASKGMKLKKLDFQVKDSFRIHLELVTLFKDSLIFLSIRFHTFVNRIDIIFPVIPKLMQLELVMSASTNLSCEDFIRTFPALQKLKLYFETLPESEQINNFITGDQSNMKSFILGGLLKMNMENFNQILTVFPVLTRLDCEVTEEDASEIIKKIWTQLRQLQGLHIVGSLPSSENLDSLVTGIPIEEIERMRVPDFFGLIEQTTTKIHRECILEQMMRSIDVAQPAIGNLQNLRSLSLSNLNTSGSEVQKPNGLTDLTAYFGLYSIKSLRHLYVSDSKFSASCREILVNDMNLITWSF